MRTDVLIGEPLEIQRPGLEDLEAERGGHRRGAEHGLVALSGADELTGEDLAHDARVVNAVASGEPGRIDLVDAELRRGQRAAQHDAVVPDRDVGRAADGDLVDAALAVNDRGAAQTESSERGGDGFAPAAVVDADDLMVDVRGVGQRAEQVEDRPRAELATCGAGVARGGVELRRKREADAGELDAARDHRGLGFDRDAEGLEHVGGAALRGQRAISVLGHHATARGDQDRGERGDIDRAGAITAGPAGVDAVLAARALECHGAAAHRGRGADQLVDRLALGAQGDEEAADLGVGRLPVHDLTDHLGHLGARQMLAGERVRDAANDRGAHALARVRKFASSAFPAVVMIDSGWNCTPSSGAPRALRRTPMISSSQVFDVTSSVSGIVSGAITSE